MSRAGIAVSLLLALALAGCTPLAADHEQISPDERVVGRLSHVTAENSPKHVAAVKFAAAASERAGGRVEIQVYPNSQLYPDWDELSALLRGDIQFIAVAPSKLIQFDPAWQVFDLPYLFTGFEQVEHLFTSPPGMELRQRLAARGLVALAIWPNGFKQFTNNRRPLVSPADFQGLVFRAQVGQVLQDQFAAVGARAVVSSFNTLYADIERGFIDAQENTLNNIYTRNLQAVQPYLTISDHGFLSYVVIVQGAWWRSLDPERRQALEEGLEEATQWARDHAQAMNEESLERLIKTGRVEVYTLTAAERERLRQAFGPAYRGIERRLGKAFTDQVLKTVAEAR